MGKNNKGCADSLATGIILALILGAAMTACLWLLYQSCIWYPFAFICE